MRTRRNHAGCVAGVVGFAAALVMALMPASGQGATCTWGGSANGDWFDPAKWVSSVPPTNSGDSVVITNGSVILTNSTPYLSSFALTNATLTFSNWTTTLTASNIWISGTLTHVTNTTADTNASGVWVPISQVHLVCTNLTIATNGGINADYKGFMGGVSGGVLHRNGYGPGAGLTNASRGGGGAYGGNGGNGGDTPNAPGGTNYGVLAAPDMPGSGGAAKVNAGSAAGNGGGYVRIEAGQVVVNGTISAAGKNGSDDSAGGGSGGGIFISCNTFTGSNGLLSANGGGGSSWGGGGGGGRIAVTFTAAAPAPSVQFSANGGTGYRAGQQGTVFLTDVSSMPSAFSGSNGRFFLQNPTPWAPDSVTVTNSWVVLPGGFELHTANDLVIRAGGRLDVSNSLAVTVGRNLILTNNSQLYVYSGPTNGSPVTNYGALVSVTGDVVIAGSNAWLYPVSDPVNGGSACFKMSNLRIAASQGTNAGIDATALGFPGGVHPAHRIGYGPGGGNADTGKRAAGGSYGGRGGNSGDTPPSLASNTYGVASLPLQPGSGGGAKETAASYGGAGGGLVWVEATNQIVLSGVIRADAGAPTVDDSAGGGSGGGIYLKCKSFVVTNGIVSANGTSGGSTYGGGGGGGRIALDYDPVSQSSVGALTTLQLSVAGGPVPAARPGGPGTLWFTDSSAFPQTLSNCTGRVLFGTGTNWTPSALSLNQSWLSFETPLAYSVAGSVSLVNTSRVDFTNSPVSIGGNLTLTNSSSVYTYSGVTTNDGTNAASTFTVVGDLSLASNCWIYLLSHPTNGGSTWISAQNVTIMSGAGIDASRGGFAVMAGTYTNGYGPGGGMGTNTAVTYAGGGGHGGRGAYAVASSRTNFGGTTYGSSNAPILPGSAGGSGGTTLGGGSGGGLVYVIASRTIQLDGAVRADGGTGAALNGGGGAGGGIYLYCRTLSGTGVVSAIGGNGNVASSGGGGGGRVALWRAFDQFSGPIMVTNGTGGANASTGTIFVGQLPAPPLVDNAPGPTNLAYFTATLQGTLTSTGTAPSYVSAYWGPTDGGTNRSAWTNALDFVSPPAQGAVLSTNISGLNPGQLYWYRFCASNAAGVSWAPASTSFLTTAAIPIMSNATPTAIGPAAATLNGWLASTGSAPTTVAVLWGRSDGGTNMGAWERTNTFAGSASAGALGTNVTLPQADTAYWYTYRATNSGGVAWAAPSAGFIGGNVWIEATKSDAAETGANNTGTFTVYRASSATGVAVTVNLQIGGAAVNGQDYAAIASNVIMAAGVSNVTITISPIMDALASEGTEAVTLTLAPGCYGIGSPASATVNIADVAPSVSNTWTGTGLWTSPSNWSEGYVPVAGQSITLSGSAALTSSPVALAALNVATGATLTFNAWDAALTAVVVTVNGTVTHGANTATSTNPAGQWIPDARVWIVCTNLTVATNGVIDASNKGFAGGTSAPGHRNGYGPGAGVAGTGRGGGGAYGGDGGAGGISDVVDGAGGTHYGTAAAADLPGSGGASKNSSDSLAGAGGGCVRIEAAEITVHGLIAAGGQAATGDSSGGGSGGGIVLSCGTLAGSNGNISANGGAGSGFGGGGGGGRITITHDPAAQAGVASRPTVQFSANGGTGYRRGGLGTVYFLDATLLGGDGLLEVRNGTVMFQNITSWAPSRLTVSNGWAAFTSGFLLTITNELLVTTTGRLDITGGALTSGSLTLTNAGQFYVYSTPTNGNAVTNYGAYVNVLGDAVIAGPNAWLYPVSDPTNGGSPYFELGNLLIISTNSGIDATGLGYSGGTAAHLEGYGPGGGRSSIRGAGGSYGGQGGNAQDCNARSAYGSLETPLDAGSGGGAKSGGVELGGCGGGLIRIKVDRTIDLRGSIKADGTSYAIESAGGGSGGGIYLSCLRFSGNGALYARGTNGGVSYGGGGGGGRIAIWRALDTFTGTVSVTNGTGWANGAAGTVYWGSRSMPGTIFTFR